MRNVIVHHRDCPDGFGAAWWLRRMLLARGDGTITEPTVELVAANWGDPINHDWIDAHVWCVDYCFGAAGLKWLAANCVRLDVIDHHQTSLDYITLSGLPLLTDWEEYVERTLTGEFDSARALCLLDQRHSGVGLVARIAHRWWKLVAPQFVWNLEDRDLWRFNHVETRDAFAAVTARPYTLEAWDDLEAIDFGALVREGRGINMYRDRLIESVAASTFMITLGGNGEGWYFQCATSPYFIGSDVAGLIAERHEKTGGQGFGAYAILHDDHVQIGLRSRGDFDVAKIAEFHGGGGHRSASGLKLTWNQFNKRVWPGLQASLSESGAV